MPKQTVFKAAMVLLLFSLLGSALADEFWSDWTRITLLYPSSQLMFLTEYSNTAVSTCDNGRRFALDPQTPDYDTKVAALLGAFYSGREIEMRIRNTPNCHAYVVRFRVR